MEQPPKWYRPVAITALVWNLIGCAAYLFDVMMSPEAVAQLTAAQQEMHASRPAWSIAMTAIAVWIGAAGCLGLVMRKSWAKPALLVSLLAVIGQDVWLFGMSNASLAVTGAAYAMQGLVLIISVALVMLANTAAKRGWID